MKITLTTAESELFAKDISLGKPIKVHKSKNNDPLTINGTTNC